MKKRAIISVISKQKVGEDDIIEVVTPGKFYKKDDTYYAIYEETEISGMQGTTTTIKIKEESMTLIRKGTTNTRMLFEKGKKDIILYSTPHGALELVLDIKGLDIKINENGGKVFAKYNMGISGQEPLKTELNINIEAKEDMVD